MTTWSVSTTAALENALNSAQGGDTIVLASGSYGAVKLTRDYSDYVTIKSATPLGAVLADLDVPGGSFVKLDGVKVNGDLGISEAAHHFKAVNSAFRGGYIDDSHDIELTGNDVQGYFGLRNASYVNIIDNYFHPGVPHAAGMQIMADSHHVLIENNAIVDVIAPNPDSHPDLIQFFSDFDTGRTPHDVTIRGNLLYDNPDTGPIGAQGIFISDAGPGGYKNILVEQNLIASVLYNALTIRSGTENVIFQDNTITQGRIWISNDQGMGNAGTIVRDNIAPSLLNDGGGATITHNYIYDVATTALFPNYVDGGTWQQYLPKPGSAVDFGTNFGALARLAELTGNGPPNPDPGPINNAPLAVNDIASTERDKAIVVNVLANDSDPDGDSLTVTSATAVNGSASVNANGAVLYTPQTGFVGTDTVNYSIGDNKGGTASAKVTVTVAAPNNPPPSEPPPPSNDPQVVLAQGSNEFDGQTSSAVILPHQASYAVVNGTLELIFNTDSVAATRQGLITKDAYGEGEGGHFGLFLEGNDLVVRMQSATDTHQLRVNDVIVSGRDYHVFVTFGDAGLKLYLNGDQVGSDSYKGGLLGNSEPIVIGANGWASDDHNANNLQDAFAGTIDNLSLSNYALSAAAIEILSGNGASNLAPVLKDDAVTTLEDKSVTIGVLANDSDPDGDALTVSTATATNGTVTINANGTLAYNPKANFNGSDTITYSVADGKGGTATAKVAVTLTPVNDAPIARDDSATSNSPVTVNVLANDSDPDGDVLTVASASAANGAVTINPSGTLAYNPNSGFQGNDTIIYSITDGKGGTASAKVNVTVAQPSEPPPPPKQLILLDGHHEFHGTTSGAVVLPHQSAYNLDNGTVELMFRADSIAASRQGLLTKDGFGYGDGGHFGIFLEGNDILVRMQSKTSTYTITAEDIVSAGVDYEVAVTFGSGGLKLYLDGNLVGSSNYKGGLTGNVESIVIGANGWASDNHNANKLQDPFDGVIKEANLFSYALSVTEIEAPSTSDNAKPIPQDDAAAARAGETIAIAVLANDTDPDGDVLTVQSALAGNGITKVNPNGTVSYTPKAGFAGSDTIVYVVSDPKGGSGTAKAMVSVAPSNNPAPSSHVVLSEGSHEFTGAASSAVVLPHSSNLALTNGTVELSFAADTLAPARQGLFTKDAYGYGNGGHFGIFLEGDDVLVRMQSASDSYEIRAKDVVTQSVDHDLSVTFGSGGMKLYLDGTLVGRNSYTGGLVGNIESTVLGANGWASTNHNANVLVDAFDGWISKVTVYDGATGVPADSGWLI